MTKVYIIRHAEAEGNLYRRIHGWYDSRLTSMGWRQVKTLEKRFEGVHIDHVYSSDKIRTQCTAQSVYLSHGLPLNTLPQIREIGVGVWEDQTWGYVQRFEKENLALFNSDPAKWRVEGSENHFAVEKRMAEAVKSLASKHDGETIALFSHGSAIRTLQAWILGIPSERISEILHCDNTGVTLLNVENGEISIEYMNDSSHLPENCTNFGKQTWWKNKNGFSYNDFRFVPVDFTKDGDREKYISYRRAANKLIGKNDDAFLEKCMENAKNRQEKCKNAIMFPVLGDEVGGLLELDTERGKNEKRGYIDVYYLDEAHRGKCRGIQLLGQAVSTYRQLERDFISLELKKENASAMGFFGSFGFEKVLERENNVLIEKDISK